MMQLSKVLTSVLLASSLSAVSAAAQQADIGAQLYTDYCSACHGAAGLGDGDMADVVNIPSPNLTLLARNNDGVFPMLEVLQIIDGRTGVRAHGGAMPVWGRVFSDQIGDSAGPYGGVLEVRGRLLSLATYIQSIQQ
ncbi:c-type cytochrome [Tabrizicola sp.]|uniref:c-type cytochrome n=1 Tax=Tabrizicola sp. TaxID=2005166 RepID=UPI002622E18F|nr:c-type cytochrome [Tabrizicola sp.]MDM7931852.1 c-type cytochrome [Tabrizicola sp.]